MYRKDELKLLQINDLLKMDTNKIKMIVRTNIRGIGLIHS